MSDEYKLLLVPEFSSSGGTRNYFYYLLNFYSSQGYEVSIALCRNQLDDEIKSLLECYKCRFHIIPSRDKGFMRFLRYFPVNLLFDIISILPIYIKENPDMIVVSNGTPGMFIGLILFPVKFIYTFHTYPLWTKIICLSSIQKTFLRIFLNRNKMLTTVSEYSKKQILDLWVPAQKSDYIKVIYNSVSKKCFVEGHIQNENTNIYRVLTLGHVIWYKNPKIWIGVAQEVIRQRPDIPIEFIWAGEGNLLEECNYIVKQMGLEGIKFIGHQSNVESLYKQSTIYFQPSLLESHGISVVEAMAHGLPCVTSDVGGLPESVINGETGFICPPDDIECFVAQIIKLLDNEKFRYMMGQSGKSRAKAFFSSDVQNKKMISLYSSLLQN
ncbi:glycosyltransferase family 4 protein [Methanococcoides sp. LMO-2]|uniref:Glycosyltransferase family 4 protein n=1 Tax=Methanococcoides cohabitans TaxID=3136559 RepID=A0ABU9KXL3_9EURY